MKRIILLCLSVNSTIMVIDNAQPKEIVVNYENVFINQHPETIETFLTIVADDIAQKHKSCPDRTIKLKLGGNMLGYYDSKIKSKLIYDSIDTFFGNISSYPITELTLYLNSLKVVPAPLLLLSSIIKLDLSHNELEYIPKKLLELPHLRHIYLNYNYLSDLPSVNRNPKLIIDFGAQGSSKHKTDLYD